MILILKQNYGYIEYQKQILNTLFQNINIYKSEAIASPKKNKIK